MEKIKYYNISNVGETVSINGWVSKVRNLGGLVFIDLIYFLYYNLYIE